MPMFDGRYTTKKEAKAILRDEVLQYAALILDTEDKWPDDRMADTEFISSRIGKWKLGRTQEKQLRKAVIYARPLEASITLIEKLPGEEDEQSTEPYVLVIYEPDLDDPIFGVIKEGRRQELYLTWKV